MYPQDTFPTIKIGARLSWLFIRSGLLTGLSLLAGLIIIFVYLICLGFGLLFAELIYQDDYHFILPITAVLFFVPIAWLVNRFFMFLWQAIVITLIQQYIGGYKFSITTGWRQVRTRWNVLWSWFWFSLRWSLLGRLLSIFLSSWLVDFGVLILDRAIMLTFAGIIIDGQAPSVAVKRTRELFSSYQTPIFKGNLVSGFYGILIFGAFIALLVTKIITDTFLSQLASGLMAIAAFIAYYIWFINLTRTINIAFYAIVYLYATQEHSLSIEPLKKLSSQKDVG